MPAAVQRCIDRPAVIQAKVCMLVHRSSLFMDFDQGQQDIRPQNSDMYCDDGPHPEGHVVYVKNPRYECGSDKKGRCKTIPVLSTRYREKFG